MMATFHLGSVIVAYMLVNISVPPVPFLLWRVKMSAVEKVYCMTYHNINSKESQDMGHCFQEQFDIFRRQAYSLSGGELDEKIDATLISVSSLLTF